MVDFTTVEADANAARAEARRREAARMKAAVLIGAVILFLGAAAWGAVSPLDAEDLAKGRMAALGAVAGAAIVKAMIAAGVVFAGVYLLVMRKADGLDSAKAFGVLAVVGYVALVLAGGLRAEVDIRHSQFTKAVTLVRAGRGSAKINAEVFDAQVKATDINEIFLPFGVSAPQTHARVQALHQMVATARTQYAQARAATHAQLDGDAREQFDQTTRALQSQVDQYWTLEDRLLDDLDALGTFLAGAHNSWRTTGAFTFSRNTQLGVFDTRAFVFQVPAEQAAFQTLTDKLKADAAALSSLRAAINAQEARDLKGFEDRLF